MYLCTIQKRQKIVKIANYKTPSKLKTLIFCSLPFMHISHNIQYPHKFELEKESVPYNSRDQRSLFYTLEYMRTCGILAVLTFTSYEVVLGNPPQNTNKELAKIKIIKIKIKDKFRCSSCKRLPNDRKYRSSNCSNHKY